jgi:diguanylate cyclase (GGDEF)-like protein/PAS domain S-box-containing protein
MISVIGVSTEDLTSSIWKSRQQVYLVAILASILIITTAILMLREIKTNQKLLNSENRIRTLIETVFDGIVSINERGYIEMINSSALHMFGYRLEEVLGQHISLLADGYQRAEVDQYIREYLLTGKARSSGGSYREISARRKDGALVSIELSIGEMQLRQERIFVGTMRDISEKKRAEENLYEVRERAHVTLQSIGDAVISTDADGKVDFLNPVAEKLTGWRSDESKGRPLVEVFRISDELSGEPVPDPLEYCLSNNRVEGLSNHTLLSSRSGEDYVIEKSAAPITSDNGNILGVVLVFKDVTESRRLSQKVQYHASHDALTGLINRREFEIRLEYIRQNAEQEDNQNVFCYMDLDQFKLVNDTCGHTAGDELLRQIAELMHSSISKRDTLGRLGGDEFGLLMEYCTIEDAQRITKKIIEQVGNYDFVWKESRFKVGISIGMVSIVRGSDSPDGLMRLADSACYSAKELGRNRLHVYQEMDQVLIQRHGEMKWAVKLPQALENDRFRLYYQTIAPIDNSHNNGLYRYEVLLRLLDEENNLVLPGLFLPAAERYKIAPDIDKWVVNYMFKWLHENPAHLENLSSCSINLSGLSIGNDAFLQFVYDQLNRYQIPPHKICFEITETVAITNLTIATSFIKALKELGCLFALDDFGSGLSSFAYLKNLPVDILKIDGLFVKNIINDPMDLAMVKSINEIGQVMGKKTIAEFVENDEILQKLNEIGVDYAQGYGISKPEPLTEIL